MEENNKAIFNYTYSAAQQEEIKRIRKKYAAPDMDKMEQLRKLDLRPTQKAQAWAIVFGVIGTLILGTGMSLAMTEVAKFIGSSAMFIGIPVGVIGIVMITLAYPVYQRILKKERKRIASEILRLTDELLK